MKNRLSIADIVVTLLIVVAACCGISVTVAHRVDKGDGVLKRKLRTIFDGRRLSWQ